MADRYLSVYEAAMRKRQTQHAVDILATTLAGSVVPIEPIEPIEPAEPVQTGVQPFSTDQAGIS